MKIYISKKKKSPTGIKHPSTENKHFFLTINAISNVFTSKIIHSGQIVYCQQLQAYYNLQHISDKQQPFVNQFSYD